MFKYPYVSCALLKRHATLPQLKKFDVTQKIVEALADVESRAIIFTMVNEAMTASDLSYALKIPLSSVYKKLSDLQELTDSARLMDIFKSKKYQPHYHCKN